MKDFAVGEPVWHLDRDGQGVPAIVVKRINNVAQDDPEGEYYVLRLEDYSTAPHCDFIYSQEEWALRCLTL